MIPASLIGQRTCENVDFCLSELQDDVVEDGFEHCEVPCRGLSARAVLQIGHALEAWLLVYSSIKINTGQGGSANCPAATIIDEPCSAGRPRVQQKFSVLNQGNVNKTIMAHGKMTHHD